MNDSLETIYSNYKRHFSDTKNTVCSVLEELANMYPEANHILFCVYNVIYALHMALFMTISGKVYAVAYLDNQGKPDRRRLYRQIGNIIVVYVLFSVAFGIVKVVFSGYIN